MVSGGLSGGLCLIGLLMLLKRRLSDARVRASSSCSDILVLVVLLVQLLLGLGTIYASTHHMDGSVMVMLADWAQFGHRDPAAAAGRRGHRPGEPGVQAARVPRPEPVRAVPLHPPGAHISAPVWYLGRRYQTL